MADIIAEPSVSQSFAASADLAANEQLVAPIKKTASPDSSDDATHSTVTGLVISPLTNRHESNGPALSANQKTEVDAAAASKHPVGEEDVTLKENNLKEGSEAASAEPHTKESAPAAAAPQEPSINHSEPESEPTPPINDQQPSVAEHKTEAEEQGHGQCQGFKDEVGASGAVGCESKHCEGKAAAEELGKGQESSEAGEAKVKDQQASDGSSECGAGAAAAVAPASVVAAAGEASAEQSGDAQVKADASPAKETKCTNL